MSDRILYFQLLNSNRQQSKLERPLLRGNYIPKRENKDEPYWGNAIYEEYQHSYGGADKNLFFKLQDKGKVRLVPFMKKRQFKDLDPKSRISFSLDTTKEGRHAAALVKGIQNISGLLNSFLSEPETDAEGNPILDSEGKVKLKKISLSDKLTVARDAVREMFQQAQVPINDNQDKLIDMLDVDDSKSILSDATSIASHDSWGETSQEEKSELLLDALVNEAINTLREGKKEEGEEIKEGDIDPPIVYMKNPEKEYKTSLVVKEILEDAIVTGDIEKDRHSRIITSDTYNSLDKVSQNDLFEYLIVRKYKQSKPLINRAGDEVPDSKLDAVLGQNFRRGNTLDLEDMAFISV